MVDKAAATPATTSYVDDGSSDISPEPEPKPQDGSESKIHQTLGEAMLLIMIAADLMLGYLIGLLTRMHTDEDYAAWHRLKKIVEIVTAFEERVGSFRT